jgi:hypothetical protein
MSRKLKVLRKEYGNVSVQKCFEVLVFKLPNDRTLHTYWKYPRHININNNQTETDHSQTITIFLFQFIIMYCNILFSFLNISNYFRIFILHSIKVIRKFLCNP